MAELSSGPPMRAKRYTTKQLGDACEMLVAAELTLAGIPALKVPDNWPVACAASRRGARFSGVRRQEGWRKLTKTPDEGCE